MDKLHHFVTQMWPIGGIFSLEKQCVRIICAYDFLFEEEIGWLFFSLLVFFSFKVLRCSEAKASSLSKSLRCPIVRPTASLYLTPPV